MRLIITVLTILVGTTAKSEGIFSWLFGSDKEIIAEVNLVNKLSLIHI